MMQYAEKTKPFLYCMLLAACTAAQVLAGPPEVAAQLDQLIEQSLREANLAPGEVASDGEFLRRACLDITGAIPSRQRARQFLDDTDPAKRIKLIDELLASPAYGLHFGRLWRERLTHEDLAGPYRRNDMGVWLAEQFNQNRSWAEIVSDILVAEKEHASAGFIYDNLDDDQPRPNKLAANTARLFLGCQLQCAECHDHPYAEWTQEDFWGLAAYFARTARSNGDGNQPPKGIYETAAGTPPTRFGPPPVKVSPDGSVVIPQEAGEKSGETVPARLMFDGDQTLPSEGPVRPLMAKWLAGGENEFFTEAAANRLWAHFFGRGFVNPIEDMQAVNESSHPAALELLAKEFAASGCDQKHLIRCICLTRAYQRTSQVPPASSDAASVETSTKQLELFGRMRIKVMNSEMLGDSIKVSADAANRGHKGVINDFAREFATRTEHTDPTEFSNGIPEILKMMNENRFFNSEVPLVNPLRISWQARQNGKPEGSPIDVDPEIEEVFVATVGRLPTEAELAIARKYLEGHPDISRGFHGLWWALVNGPEFPIIP